MSDEHGQQTLFSAQDNARPPSRTRAASQPPAIRRTSQIAVPPKVPVPVNRCVLRVFDNLFMFRRVSAVPKVQVPPSAPVQGRVLRSRSLQRTVFNKPLHRPPPVRAVLPQPAPSTPSRRPVTRSNPILRALANNIRELHRFAAVFDV